MIRDRISDRVLVSVECCQMKDVFDVLGELIEHRGVRNGASHEAHPRMNGDVPPFRRQQVVHDDQLCLALKQHPYERGTDEARASCNEDRKSTRLNSSHITISYAVFCLKK